MVEVIVRSLADIANTRKDSGKHLLGNVVQCGFYFRFGFGFLSCVSKLAYFEGSDPSPGHEVDGYIPGITAAALLSFEADSISLVR